MRSIRLIRIVSERRLSASLLPGWALAYERERLVRDGLAQTYCPPGDAALTDYGLDRNRREYRLEFTAPDPIQMER